MKQEVDIPAAVKAVQDYFRDRTGVTRGTHLSVEFPLEPVMEQFYADYGIRCKTDGQLMILDYDQIEVKRDTPLGYVCRGLILDAATFDVISFGLTKFFNYGEGYAADVDWANTRVYEKLDGSMLQRFWNPYAARFEFSTRFQLPRDMALNECKFGLSWKEVAERCLMSLDTSAPNWHNRDLTVVVEIMGPANKIVVQHKEYGAKVLAVRNRQSLTEAFPETAFPSDQIVKSFYFPSLESTLEFAKSLRGAEQEGYVVVDDNFNRIKIKGDEYVQLHRLKDDATGPKALILLARGNDFDEVVVHFPELKKPLDEAAAVMEQLIKAHEEAYSALEGISTKKNFALEVKKFPELHSAALFQVRDGKVGSVREYFMTMRENSFIDLMKAQLPADFGA